MRYILIFFFGVVCAEQKYWLPIIPPYDLQSDQRYTLYLPARVNQLQQLISQNGLLKTINFIKNHDHDLESFLFIISVDEPSKMLAYSRHAQFFNKKTAQIQELIFPSPENHFEQVGATFDELISTARKGDTYHVYTWRFDIKDSVHYQVAYVHLMTINNKKYVIGASVIAEIIPECIILPHRTKTVLSRLRKESFDRWLDSINNDPDEYQYFEVYTTDQTYRWIASGTDSDLIGKTALDEQKIIFKNCTTVDCDITRLWDAFSYVVRRGGGYNAYLWREGPDDPIELQIAYSFPFEHKKIPLFLCTGYRPPWLKDYIRTDAPVVVEKALELIKEVGLENTLSAIRKANKSRLFVFVVEQEYPYLILEYFDPLLRGKTAVEATAFARGNHNLSVNYIKLFSDMVDYVQFRDGFYAYEFIEPIAHAIPRLKVGYLKSLTYNQKKYVVGATYVSLQDPT